LLQKLQIINSQKTKRVKKLRIMKLEKNNPRRDFIKKSVMTAAGLTILPALSFGDEGHAGLSNSKKAQPLPVQGGVKTVALICHAYYRRSHADVLFTKFF